MNKTIKAKKLQAKFQSISDAAEFIRSHGEEGFSFKDPEFMKYYLNECKLLAEKLDKSSI
jgi:hypothetical protein